MYIKDDIVQVKNYLQNVIGSKVTLSSNKGKQKAFSQEGVLECVYPSVFTVQLYEGQKAKNRISYSYTDVLTRSVELTIYQ